MRNEVDIRNYQASIKLLLKQAASDKERAFYLGVYNALDWVCDKTHNPSKLHYKLVKKKEV